jgi:sulfur transfer protein SufE
LKENISELENKNSCLNEKNEELIKSFEENNQTKELLQQEIENKENEIKSKITKKFKTTVNLIQRCSYKALFHDLPNFHF